MSSGPIEKVHIIFMKYILTFRWYKRRLRRRLAGKVKGQQHSKVWGNIKMVIYRGGAFYLAFLNIFGERDFLFGSAFSNTVSGLNLVTDLTKELA